MPPSSAFRFVRFTVLVASLAALGTLGCGEKSPEELLQEATQDLAKATQTKDAAKVSLDQLEERLDDAQKARDTAFEAYEEARSEWEQANEAVGEFATDEVLHHQLNQALLDEPGLKSSTIQARVNLRVATLVGNAGSQEAIDKAVEIAEGVPGVARVVPRIDLGPARPEGSVAPAQTRRLETEEAPDVEPDPDPDQGSAPDRGSAPDQDSAPDPEPADAEPEADAEHADVVEDQEAAAPEAEGTADETDLQNLEIPEIQLPEGEWHPEADPMSEGTDRPSSGAVIERQI